MEQETVFVGLSGGVDSSVAALRLQKAGHHVVGVFIKVWHPDWLACNWEQERLDAMRVAAHLNIPFLTCDAETVYKNAVARYFIDEYAAGRTPNPDVLCNQYVKFGAFLDFATAHGADAIATGHYARRCVGPTGPELHRGVDGGKDQSYFLWSLTTAQLSASYFPIGETSKATVRAEAAAAGLPTATKQDSQGICFLGHVDIPEFLRHYVTLTPGPVVDTHGKVIGEHQGALLYTLGQRHGFTISTQDSSRPSYYVIDKDVATNTITVDTTKPQLQQNENITLQNCVWRTGIRVGETYQAQCRYRQTPFSVVVRSCRDTEAELALNDTADVRVDKAAVGQSCVLYRDTHCVGGGIIAS